LLLQERFSNREPVACRGALLQAAPIRGSGSRTANRSGPIARTGALPR